MDAKRWACAVACVVTVSAVTAYFARDWGLRFAASQVRLEPSVAELIEPIQEGETTRPVLLLNNSSSRVITIDNVALSCGCMRIVTRGGSTLIRGLSLAPGESLPLQVSLDTSGVSGSREYGVALGGYVGGSVKHRFDETSAVRCEVQAGVRVEPAVLVAISSPGGPNALASGVVYDGRDGAGIELAPLGPMEDGIVARLSRVPVERQTRDATTGLTPRYQLDVTLDVPRHQQYFEGIIELVPADVQQTPLRVPIRWNAPRPSVEFSPRVVAFEAMDHGGALERAISCRVNDPRIREISLGKVPGPLTAELVRLPSGEYLLRLTCTVVSKADCGDFELQIVVGDVPEVVAALPIRVRMRQVGG